jgi:hypothetical protein
MLYDVKYLALRKSQGLCGAGQQKPDVFCHFRRTSPIAQYRGVIYLFDNISMLGKHTGNPLKTVFLLTLLGVFLITNSCGHAKASPSPVATAAVMKTIQDYGRDHHSLLTPGSLAEPDEPDGLYSTRIKNLSVQEDFAPLEKIAQQNRIEKGRLLEAASGKRSHSTMALESQCRR